MDARAIIAKLRYGKELSTAELQEFAQGLATGQVSDAQAGAFAMAACLNGLGPEGRVAFTEAMRDSGDVLTWADLPGPIVDKHSTGGIGDCVSLVLAPALAACGVYVPMISGRGLGHTGGTLDKLSAIPGLQTQLPEQRLRQIVQDVGCAIVGSTGQIAPADKVLYRVRDVTSTVESIDLITASILSKKLAAGTQALVLDVKVGTGAFMTTLPEAEGLARALVDTANGAGCHTAALITDMNTPLAPAVGNAVETAVCLDVLSGNIAAAPRLHELVVVLGARALVLSGTPQGEATQKITEALSSGKALAHFTAMVAAMGGPPDMDADWRTHLPKAPVQSPVLAKQDGYVARIDGQALGRCVVAMGGGRKVETDRIDPAVGLTDTVGLGAHVARGQPICIVHARTDDAAAQAAEAVQRAYTIGDAPDITPLVVKEVT